MQAVGNQSLPTCQQVGLSGTNGVYDGDQGQEAYTNVDRTAVQWLKFPINTNGEPVTFYGCGRIYDDALSNAFYYYFPSVTVNCAGDMVAGFSGSSVSNYIGAYYSWCPAGSSAAGKPRILQAGKEYYQGELWGDYSYTSLDPTDNLTFWTVQEYAETPTESEWFWGTWIGKIMRGP